MYEMIRNWAVSRCPALDVCLPVFNKGNLSEAVPLDSFEELKKPRELPLVSKPNTNSVYQGPQTREEFFSYVKERGLHPKNRSAAIFLSFGFGDEGKVKAQKFLESEPYLHFYSGGVYFSALSPSRRFGFNHVNFHHHTELKDPMSWAQREGCFYFDGFCYNISIFDPESIQKFYADHRSPEYTNEYGEYEPLCLTPSRADAWDRELFLGLNIMFPEGPQPVPGVVKLSDNLKVNIQKCQDRNDEAVKDWLLEKPDYRFYHNGWLFEVIDARVSRSQTTENRPAEPV